MKPDTKESIAPTKRERELMVLIARGLQNKNIAYELNISENTVRAHIGNIMRKFHLHNRTQIAVIVALQGPATKPRRDAQGARSHANSTVRRTSAYPSSPASTQASRASSSSK